MESDEQSLSDWNGSIISDRKDTLTAISKYLVADVWFSKKSFTDKVISSGIHLVIRLRDDADLKYISTWLSIPKEERGAFSMSDIKTMNHNRLMLNRFFDVFGIYPHSAKNQKYVKELIL